MAKEKITILDGKYELVGTSGKDPVYDPVSKKYLNLHNITPAQALDLVLKKFPYLKVVKLTAAEIKAKEEAEKAAAKAAEAEPEPEPEPAKS